MNLIICAPDIFSGDAVGNHCFGLARMGERLGFDVKLYAQRHENEVVVDIEQLFEFITSQDILIISYSIFDENLDRLLQLKNKKVCYFHGVTEPELLREFEPVTADLCALSFSQFEKLSAVDILIANSQHTAKVLSKYVKDKNIEVIPPVFSDMEVFDEHRNSVCLNKSTLNLLVVGRNVPHKKIEDAIKILANIRAFGIDVNLTVVGSAPNIVYSSFLQNYSADLGVEEYVEFKGMLSNKNLYTCYEQATALLSVSQHEGFCVPVLEAMHFGLPVFVRSGTAASEVGGAACIGFDDLDKGSEQIYKVLNDTVQHEQMVTSGKARAKEILKMTEDNEYKDLLLN